MKSEEEESFQNFMLNSIVSAIKRSNFPIRNTNVFDENYKNAFLFMFCDLIKTAMGNEEFVLRVASSDEPSSHPLTFVTEDDEVICFIWWDCVFRTILKPIPLINNSESDFVFNCNGDSDDDFDEIQIKKKDIITEDETLTKLSDNAFKVFIYLFVLAYQMKLKYLKYMKIKTKNDFRFNPKKIITLGPHEENERELFGSKYV